LQSDQIRRRRVFISFRQEVTSKSESNPHLRIRICIPVEEVANPPTMSPKYTHAIVARWVEPRSWSISSAVRVADPIRRRECPSGAELGHPTNRSWVHMPVGGATPPPPNHPNPRNQALWCIGYILLSKMLYPCYFSKWFCWLNIILPSYVVKKG